MDDKILHKLFRQASPQAWDRTPSCPDEHEIAAYVDATIQESGRDKAGVAPGRLRAVQPDSGHTRPAGK